MKIAIVGVEAHKRGGVERYTYELVRATGAELFAANSEIKFHKIPTLRGPDILSKNLFLLFAQLFIKPSLYDIIHSQGATYLTPHITSALTSQPKVLELLRADELFLSISLVRKFYWHFRIAIPYILEKKIYSSNIPIIAISNLLKQELINKYNIPSHRIYVIYPGIDLGEFHPDPELRKSVRESLNLKGDVLLFVGSQWGRKGLRFLIDAVAYEPVTLLVVGGRNEKIKVVPKNVRFLGYKEGLCRLYNAADIFVFPSLFDAFGLTVLEAMACGVPVVVSKFAGASEIVEDGGIVINNPRDPKEIREKILIAKLHKKEMSRKAYEIAKKYSWDIIGQKIKNLYLKLLNK